METNTQYCDNSASATTFSSHAETINSTAFASNITNLIQYLQSSSSNPAPKTTTSNHASPGATNLPRTRVPFQRFFAPNTYPQTRNAEWHGDRDRNVTHAGDQNFESTNYARNEDTESGSDRPHELWRNIYLSYLYGYWWLRFTLWNCPKMNITDLVVLSLSILLNRTDKSTLVQVMAWWH